MRISSFTASMRAVDGRECSRTTCGVKMRVGMPKSTSTTHQQLWVLTAMSIRSRRSKVRHEVTSVLDAQRRTHVPHDLPPRHHGDTEDYPMISLCTNHDSCGGVNFGYGWEHIHRLSVMALKKIINIARFTTCPKCSGRTERIAA